MLIIRMENRQSHSEEQDQLPTVLSRSVLTDCHHFHAIYMWMDHYTNRKAAAWIPEFWSWSTLLLYWSTNFSFISEINDVQNMGQTFRIHLKCWTSRHTLSSLIWVYTSCIARLICATHKIHGVRYLGKETSDVVERKQRS